MIDEGSDGNRLISGMTKGVSKRQPDPAVSLTAIS